MKVFIVFSKNYDLVVGAFENKKQALELARKIGYSLVWEQTLNKEEVGETTHFE